MRVLRLAHGSTLVSLENIFKLFHCIAYVFYIEHIEMDKQKTYLQVQLPAAIADEIKRQAEQELISSAAVIRRILAEHVRERLEKKEEK